MRYYLFFSIGALTFFGIGLFFIGIFKLVTASKQPNQKLALQAGLISILQSVIDLFFGFLYYKFIDELAENWLLLILITSFFLPIFLIAEITRKRIQAKISEENLKQ